MNELDSARRIINDVDKEIAELFCKRMEAVKCVAAYKKERGLPIFDEQREALLLENNSKLINDDELMPYYVRFLQNTMDVSKQYQIRLNGTMKIAFSGVKGSFAQIAAKKIFSFGETISFNGFFEAYKAVENGECDCVVLPLENSYNGDVGQVMDLAFFGPLYVNGIYNVSVTQHLLAKKGTVLSDIKEVISHPQALGQCADYIKHRGFSKTECENTAVAAKNVAESNRTDIAAIASESAATEYGLDIIEHNINDNLTNTTKFAVFSRALKSNNNSDGKFLMFFTVKNESGSLGKALSVIGENGFNLVALKSRPTKDLIWNYYFYVEGEGNVYTKKGEKMLNELKNVCSHVKVVGTFTDEVNIGR